jgi:hypothetical protein
MTQPRRSVRVTPELAPLTPAPPPLSELDLLRQIAALRQHVQQLQDTVGRMTRAFQQMGPLKPSPMHRSKR